MLNRAQLLVFIALTGIGICPVAYAQSSNDARSEIECDTRVASGDEGSTKPRSTEPIYSPEENASQANQPAIINSINININPIFDENDPKENYWLFRLANRLHILTRQEVIRDDLLFDENTPLNQTVVDASERTLNTRRYLNQARIDTVSSPCSNKVDINVVVRDVWTLKPKIGFSRSGGNSNSNYGFEDSNFLGTGKALSLMHFSNELRSGSVLDYHDPNTGAYSSQLRLRYSDNDDGIEKRITINRPFLDLSTKWTGEINHDNTTLSEANYIGGEEVASFDHQ